MIHSKDSRFTPFHLLPKIEFMKIKSLKLSHSVSLFSLLLLLLLCVFVVYRLLSPMLFVHYYGESVCVSLIRYSATGWCWCCRAVSVHCFYVLDFLIRCSFFIVTVVLLGCLSVGWLNGWLLVTSRLTRDQYNLFLVVNFCAYLFFVRFNILDIMISHTQNSSTNSSSSSSQSSSHFTLLSSLLSLGFVQAESN